MNQIKSLLLPLTVLITFTVFFIILRFMLSRFKVRRLDNGSFNPSIGVWFGLLLLSFAVVAQVSFSALGISLGNLNKLSSSNLTLEFLKVAAILLAVSLAWFFFWLLIVTFLVKIMFTAINEHAEMAANSYGYFILKGSTLFAIFLASSEVFKGLLMHFVPSIEIPIFH